MGNSTPEYYIISHGPWIMDRPSVTDEYRFRGIDTVILENESLRVVVLPGKGGDVLELRDKRTDVNLLFEAPHNWQVPDSGYVQSTDTETGAWMDHYPGGWQDCLPMGGNDPSSHGAEYGIHGESALLPWEYEITRDDRRRVEVTLACDLVRFPFHVERSLALERGGTALVVEESVTNEGRVELPLVWLQHIAFGEPLLSSDARIDLPGGRVAVESEPLGESPLTWGDDFEWPTDDDGTDLRSVPEPRSDLHDLSYLHDLSEGWYAITNPSLDLGVAVSFDETLFESVWCWRGFGGFESSPFFGRETVLGLEPCTGWPSSNIPESQGPDGTDTLKTLAPDETVETAISVSTYGGRERVTAYDEVVE